MDLLREVACSPVFRQKEKEVTEESFRDLKTH